MDELRCDLCGREFKNRAGLGGHKAVRHGEKKPPQPKLRDVVRDALVMLEQTEPRLRGMIKDGLAMLEQRLSVMEGEARELKAARLEQPFGEGTPHIHELVASMTAFMDRINRAHTIQEATLVCRFKEAIKD